MMVWEWLSEAPPLHHKGAIARHGHWLQVPMRSEKALPFWIALELVGTYTGLIEGWVVSDPDAPALAPVASIAPAANPTPPAAASGVNPLAACLLRRLCLPAILLAPPSPH